MDTSVLVRPVPEFVVTQDGPMHHVVLFSGGMDSTACLNHVVKKYGKENVTAMHISYGSMHNHKEKKAAENIVRHFGITAKGYKLPADIFIGAGSTLMGEGDIPDGKYRVDGPQSTVVPFRNGTFISVATAHILRYGAGEVWIAAHADDSEGWAYPDCSPEFLEAMADAVHIASMGEVRLMAPYQWMSKDQIVAAAYHEDAPLQMSYSCYKGDHLHCGECATCIDRHNAFVNAGFEDPTHYKVDFSPVPELEPWDVEA